MGRSGIAIFGALCAAPLAGMAGLAAPAEAAPAKAACATLNTMDDLLGDLQFDLGNLRVVLNNVYASPDAKKHDEDFRLNLLVNVVGRLKDAANQSGSDEAKRGFASVETGFADLQSAIHDQFVLVQDEHYDFSSSIHYRTPRLTGGTPAAPEAYGAVDSLDEKRQSLADAVVSLRGSTGCAVPDGDDGSGPDASGPDGNEPQCRFHPGSFNCDATGSIEH